jgi:hypothetical protein
MGDAFVPELRRMPAARVRPVLRRGTLVFAIASALAATGCGIEWERSAPIAPDVAAELHEQHGVEEPEIECIKREVFGALWACRAETTKGEFECEVETSPPTKKILSLECKRRSS